MKGSRRAFTQSRLNGWNFRHRTWIVHCEAGIRSTHQRNRFLCTWSPTSALLDRIPVRPLLMMSSQKFSSFPPGESKPKEADNSAGIDPHTIAYVASEAEAVLHFTSAARKPNKYTIESPTDSIRAADYAANRLLVATSHLTPGLKENILQQKSHSPAATIHRAVVTVISWCLDEIEKRKDSEPHDEAEESVLNANDLEKCPTTGTLQSAVALARRAHELSLPLHLPLYQQLMERIAAASREYDSNIAASSVSLILEVSSWVEATLDAPVDPSLFRSSLARFIKDGRFSHAYELLSGLRTDHEINYLDAKTTIDLMVTLVCTLCDTLFEHKKYEDVVDASSFLEQSLIFALIFGDIEEEDEDEDEGEYFVTRERIRKRFTAYVDNLSEEELSKLMDYLEVVWVRSINEDDRCDSDDTDFSDFDLIELWESVEPQANDRLKKILFDLMKAVRPSSGSDASDSKGRLHAIVSYEDKENKRVYQAFVIENIENDEGERNEEQECIGLADLIYSPTRLDFPDITYQLNELIKGQELKFSKEYEEILCMRDHEEDMEFLKGLKKARFDDQDDDDDDDDSDDDIDSDDGF